MSLLDQVEDWLLSEAEVNLRNHAKRVEWELERYANRLIARMLRTLALGIAGITFLIAGAMLVLLGAVSYLSSVISAPLAWGFVGVAAGACGAFLLYLARR